MTNKELVKLENFKSTFFFDLVLTKRFIKVTKKGKEFYSELIEKEIPINSIDDLLEII